MVQTTIDVVDICRFVELRELYVYTIFKKKKIFLSCQSFVVVYKLTIIRNVVLTQSGTE